MVRTLLRVAFAVPLLVIGLGAASAAAQAGPARPLCADAADTNHVAIVVEHGNDQVVTQCVGFDSPTITALAVLQDASQQDRSFDYATDTYPGLGAAVCQIGDEPAHYAECLPGSGSYWVFFTAGAGGHWSSAAHGVSTTTVSDGGAVGFRYDALTGGDPPPASPAGVCPTAPPPTPSAAPTASAAPTPVGTSHPAGPTPTHSVIAPDPTEGSTPPSSRSASPASQSAGVLGLSSPGASPAPALVATKGDVGSAFSPALVIAVFAIAALIGVLGIQGFRRRRQ